METLVKIPQYRVYQLSERPDMLEWMRRLADVVNDNGDISTSDVFHGLLNALGQVTSNLNIPHDIALDAFTTCLQRMEARKQREAS